MNRVVCSLIIALVGLLLSAVCGTVQGADTQKSLPQPAVTKAEIDFDNCISAAGNQFEETADPNVLAGLLGLKDLPSKKAGWSTGPVQHPVRHFRVCFKKPVQIGTISSHFAGENTGLARLKNSSEYPGPIGDDTAWKEIPGRHLRVLRPGTKVRALRFTDRNFDVPWAPDCEPSRFGRVLLLKRRYYNALRLGRSKWTLKDAKGRWLGFWIRPLPVSAVCLPKGLPKDLQVEILGAEIDRHPAIASPESWKRLQTRNLYGSVLVFEKPVSCRALRVTSAHFSHRRHRPAILPLVALEAGQKAPSLSQEAPFTFNYEMPLDGLMAIRIDDVHGNLVRRLLAEVERQKGPVLEPWDLKNASGRYVEPGRYRWTGVACPPLKLTYLNTVYNAGEPPWRAPVRGGGWWMADHSPPVAVCAAGDVVFMGALGSEFGDSLIATDLDGNKIWRDEHQGVERLVSDGRYGYIVNNNYVMRVDPRKGFERRKIYRFKYSETFPGHRKGYYRAYNSGVAAYPGLLCVAYNAPPPPWITSAFSRSEIDIAGCFPPIVDEEVHDTELTPKQRVYSAFLTMQSSQQSYFGDAVQKGPLAHTLILKLKKEVPIGSVLLPDARIRVRALKPGRTLPTKFKATRKSDDLLGAGSEEDPEIAGLAEFDSRFERDRWVLFDSPGKDGRPIVAAPEKGLRTGALAFTGTNLKRIDYALVLKHRFRDATPEAELVMLEGKRKDGCGWVTQRGPHNPISPGNPAIAGFVWPELVPLRGFALLRPMLWASVEVDVWDGPTDAEITKESFRTETNWRKVRCYEKSENRMKFGWHTNVVIKKDFRRTLDIRAVRVRIVEPPQMPVAPDSPVCHGGFEALVTFRHIGKDPDLPESHPKRITVLKEPDGKNNAKLVGHFKLSTRAIAFGPDGELFAATDAGIERVKNTGSVEGVTKPGTSLVVSAEKCGDLCALEAGSEGLLYGIDRSRKYIRVFDPHGGRLVRTIGTPGGMKAGPYEPTRFVKPVALSIDRDGKLWVVDQAFQPKRITRWSKTGQLEKQFLGPTHYGGGGKMDTRDPTVVNHLGMKFRIDYDDKTWRLESILRRYGSNTFLPDRVFYHKGHRYLVGDRPVVTPFGDDGPVTAICQEEDGRAVTIVAAGMLAGWKKFARSEWMQTEYADLDASKTGFIWSDFNHDSEVTEKELQLLKYGLVEKSPYVGRDLSLNYAGKKRRLRSTSIREDGIPVYDLERIVKVEHLDAEVMVTRDGGTFVMGNKFLAADGRLLWPYRDKYRGVQGSNKTPWGFYSRPPGVLSGSTTTVGHFSVAGEHLFCVGGNNGDYYAFTRDGLLAATIVGGPRGYGKRFFTMPEANPGRTDLTGLRKTVEDFHGHVARVNGQVYAIAGKNHVTVMRVDGLERIQRLGGELKVTREDIKKTETWAARQAALRQQTREPKVTDVPFLRKKPDIDGEPYVDWPEGDLLDIRVKENERGDILELYRARFAFDRDNLYVTARGLDDSPMRNGADEVATLFQRGDGLDIRLGLDPNASPDRQKPAPGDVRIVIASVKGKPRAVLYRYKKLGRSLGGKPRTFTSPMGKTHVEEFVQLTEARVAIERKKRGKKQFWHLEAAIPWASLGWDGPEGDTTIRGDVGVLVSDQNGVQTVTRYYWSNKSHVIMGDLRAEAAIHPALWGKLRFRVPDAFEGALDEGGGDEEDGIEGIDGMLP